ncbi:sigma 54-interacting transcriptional regulator [Vibrio ezurae]|uniref:Putative transcriptional regulator n=1 Tax=Vibrio ezurae NBRC 102218 TaxID=1219080 RepID=U3CIG2_9VIBR|nr:sigma 54-interacting transcriptional regulator [Vibrio ezurae]GAD80954.1 putative transcriptional regulator [Vibrio ezurae NBRC 102218]
MNNSEKMCLVAPYEELAIAAERLQAIFPVPVDIYRTDLTHVTSDIAYLEDKNYGMLISRGGCAEILRTRSLLPVMEIKISLFDLFDALSPFMNTSMRIAIIGFRSVIYSCMAVAEKLNVNCELLIIEDDNVNNIDQQIMQIKSQLSNNKFDWIIGDAVYKDYFESSFSKYTIIESSDDSILRAIEDANELCKSIVSRNKESTYYQTLFDHYHNGLISIDTAGEVIHINTQAMEILGFESTTYRTLSCIHQDFHSAIDWDKLNQGLKVIGKIVETSKGSIIVSQIPMLSNGRLYRVLLNIQTTGDIQGMEYNVRRHEIAKRGLATRYTFDDILTNNSEVKRRLKMVKEYAKTDATIMIYGESGTGKEMVAQSIHGASNRCHGPFVAVNCGALASQILESELFGYVSGAFTGASAKGKVGLFELAHGGTIFLDEISELDMNLQSRLLRVLQERQIMRLGSTQVIPVDIRIISASNNQLKMLVKENKFREDLYYRLNILKASPLPLRERIEDIEFIGRHLLKSFAKKYNKPQIELSRELWGKLRQFQWSGNVRQLSNIIERIVLSSNLSPVPLEEASLLLEDIDYNEEVEVNDCNQSCPLTQGTFKEIRHEILERVLAEENFNKSKASKRLEVDRTSINRWLKKNQD